MVRYRFLRAAAIALGLYGALGLCTAAAMLVVGYSTLSQVASLALALERERASLVQSIRTASGTLAHTTSATNDFRRSIDNARGAADQASKLANDSAGTFRNLGATLTSITVFGVQPMGGLGPQFDNSADQLQQLAISLGTTRDALGQNSSDVQQIGSDLFLLQTQMDAVATSLGRPGVLGFDPTALVPFQIAIYGMCLLVILQSAFSIVIGIMLYRLARALGADAALFPTLGQQGLPPIKTATTSGGEPASDRVRAW